MKVFDKYLINFDNGKKYKFPNEDKVSSFYMVGHFFENNQTISDDLYGFILDMMIENGYKPNKNTVNDIIKSAVLEIVDITKENIRLSKGNKTLEKYNDVLLTQDSRSRESLKSIQTELTSLKKELWELRDLNKKLSNYISELEVENFELCEENQNIQENNRAILKVISLLEENK